MRYIIQFGDKTTQKVEGHLAKEVMKALSEKKPVILEGAYFAPHHILSIKPMNEKWIGVERAAIESRRDNNKLLSAPNDQ